MALAEEPYAVGAENEDDAADRGAGEGGGEEEEIPEMLDLVDAAEETGEDAAALATIIRNIGRRIRATPGDRDLLSDFEGIPNICKALAGPPHEWQGDAMLAFCRVMPDVCKQSTVNRGSLRDAGFVVAVVEFLRSALFAGDEAATLAASIALSAVCTANDGNKKAAAQLVVAVAIEVPEGADDTDQAAAVEYKAPEKSGALVLLLDALGQFPESPTVQTEAISALRALLTDDDTRKADCQPSAVDNREVATSDAGFPFFGVAVERALAMVDASDKPMVKLHEQSLLLLRELARRQDRVQALALDAKLLKRAQSAVEAQDPRVVRAGLAVLRTFSIIEEVRDEIGFMTDGAQRCLFAVRKHLATAAVCEAGFGLFANLTMRKSPITGRLCDCEPGIIGLGLAVLRQHRDRPDLNRSTVHTLRNVASQEEAASTEVKESDIFEEVRKLVLEHESDPRWKAAVDISRQFLREFRADVGMEKKAEYNQFY
mmetsp:Transcript_47232/g.135373  ORF Transcript_47232/g.135373 Transcript_47232/m.135373 type:complete len:487 (+) Transcript_47232:51-1511(+)